MRFQVLIAIVCCAAFWTAGCKKKVASVTPPAPVAQTESAPTPAPPSPAEAPVQAAAEPTRTPAAPEAEPVESFEQQLARLLRDAHFDYDRHNIREDARQTLVKNGGALRELFQRFPDARIRIEGHADERGSAEYNLALGDRRATATREFLTEIGAPADRLSTISFGKEKPQCMQPEEGCWQLNRRSHFTADGSTAPSARD